MLFNFAMMAKTQEGRQKAIIDSSTLIELFSIHGVAYVKSMFKYHVLVLTNAEFVNVNKFIEKQDKIEISKAYNPDLIESTVYEMEAFIYDDNISVPITYKTIDKSVNYEFYLRKFTELSNEHALLIATARDLGATVVSSNGEILNAAGKAGLKTINLPSTRML